MPWSREDLTRLVELEAHQQGVDPRLAVALAEQESGFNPTNRSPKGAYGIFQLMPGTAKQLKVNIDDPADNIRGGVTYLKQQLDAFGGDPAKAIAAYNAGPGVVQAYKGVPPYKETRGLVSRVLGSLGPASAEAATPQAQPQAGGMSRLQELEAHLARLEGRAAPQAPQAQAPSPPTARSTPAQDAAYRASRGQQEPATAPQTAPPEPSPDPTATPGMRFQALPSLTQLEPADRLQKTRDFERLKPELQEEFLRSEEPAAGGLAIGGGPVAQARAVTDPAALLAVGQGAPSREQQILAEARARQLRGETQAVPLPPGVPTIEQETLQEGITKPSTMIPLLMPGAGLKLVPGALKTAAPFVQRLARPVAEGVSQTAGWTAGRTAETGEVPSPAEIGKEAAWNIGTGAIVEVPGAVRDTKRALLRSTPGAQILLKQQAVKEAEGLGSRVFAPQDKAVVSRVFDDVAATGEKLDVQPVRDYWKSLIPDERRIAARELKAINPRFAEEMINPRFQGWDIGELQDLRSHLLKASTTRKNPATQDLLQGMRGSVDDAITQAMSKGSLAAEQLTQAQAAWRKVKQAEDLQGMVTKHTRESPNLQWQELNLAALSKDVHGGGSKAARKVMDGMSKTEREVLQQELESLKRHYPFVRVNDTASRVIGGGSLLTAGGLALTGNLPGAAAALLPVIVTAASRSPTVMSLFKRSIIEGKGRLSQHHVDALLNAIRHENEGEPPAQ